ncbi:homeobox-leucine zipper protein HOX1-like [Iris pallida]|uniref:Homeobox-leucine zipper protein HOX1-like n=1 Tax=Iris pallida TaxID=29817 RepID=A0AAX6H3I9_IRIPA|nr:homeobox-leucine zipper protein HOX1-like [Iris pallida]
MMVGKEADLGLSLSLGPQSAPRHLLAMAPKPHWTELASAGERRLRGIDVNRAPVAAAERESEEDYAAGGASSSPNSAVSSVMSGGAGKRDHEENCSDEDDGDGSRKKLRLSKDQSAVLEDSFKEHNTLNPKQKLALAKQLNLRPRQVEVWFQNRRARTKLKQTEVDCEFLKRCCENLTEENRRLHKEVQELRALKLSPQRYMHMTPPTTLTMCPSCERISPSSSAAPHHHNQHHLHHQLQHQHQHRRPIAAAPSFLDAPPPQRS